MTLSCLFWCVWGCSPKEATATRVAEASTVQDEFISAFRAAHARRDVDAAMKLVHLEGVQNPRESEARFRSLFEGMFESPITNVSIGGPEPSQHRGYVRRGTRYQPNVRITATLIVEYDVGENAGHASTSLPLGRFEGRLVIPSAIPVP